MRTLTVDGLKGVLSATTEQVYLFALKINHDDLEEPIYIVQNTTDLTITMPSEGDKVFTAYSFEFTLPAIEENSLPQAQIKIDNINDFLIPFLRTAEEPPEFDIYIVRKDPDATNAVIEVGPLSFVLKSVIWDVRTIEGTITTNYDYLNEPIMKYRFTPDIAIGLFDYSYKGAGSFIRETTPDGGYVSEPSPVENWWDLP